MPKDKLKTKTRFDNARKKLDIPPVFFLDNIVFNKQEAWAYYRVKTVPFDFLSANGQVSVAKSNMNALQSLCSARGGEVMDFHMLITSKSFEIDKWENQVEDLHTKWINPEQKDDPVFEKFIQSQSDDLYIANYKKKVIYMGVKLYTRGTFDTGSINAFEYGFSEAKTAVKQAFKNMLSVPNEYVDEEDQNRAKSAEASVFQILEAGYLDIIKPTSSELLLSVKQQFYPAMEAPFLEVDHENRIGLSDIVLETGGYVQPSLRHLKFNQIVDGHEEEGYRATLSLSKLPKNGVQIPYGPPPFLYYPSKEGYPFTVSARFSLIPKEDMKKSLHKFEQDQKDEHGNLNKTGQNTTVATNENDKDLAVLSHQLHNSAEPWMSGSYRITVEGRNPDFVRKYVEELKQKYKEHEFVLTWTAGDQKDLFLEEMIGGTLKNRSFKITTNLAMLGASGFNFGGDVGDPIQQRIE